jgi:hypothetical protein
MCYNCGCKKYDEDHGDSENITDETLDKLADKQGVSVEEVCQNMIEGLNQQI